MSLTHLSSNARLIMNYKLIILSLILALGLSGCFYDNKDDLLEEMAREGTIDPVDPPGCQTDSVSYAAFIQPLLNSNCRSCHRQGGANGGVRLDTYAFVQAVAKSGQLVGVLNNDGFPLMPPNRRLDDCTIAQVTSWVDEGSLEN